VQKVGRNNDEKNIWHAVGMLLSIVPDGTKLFCNL